MHFTFRTAGESHGRGLIALVEGMPAGVPLSAGDIDPQLKRRQGGYGRGDRMKIEQDRAEFIAGVRHGETLGSPIALAIWNRDWENWRVAMAHEPQPDATPEERRVVDMPRPGHADLVGVLKYDRSDARDILERASARETTARVAAGAVARALLRTFGITVGSHIVAMGSVQAEPIADLPEDLNAAADASPVRVIDKAAEARMMALIDQAKANGDTLGGCFEVVARGLPPGLGSHISWDRRLDGRLAQALMSIQAMKGVEIGLGFEAARRFGSQVHDVIDSGYTRASNNAGGLEGGMTTGGPLVLRVAMKPLSTLMRPMQTASIGTGQRGEAVTERSDVAALAAAGVVGEAMVAIVLADAMLEKFGGDSLAEMRRNFDSYRAYLAQRGSQL